MADFFDDEAAEADELCQECQVATATVQATYCEACAARHADPSEDALHARLMDEQEEQEPDEREEEYHGYVATPDQLQSANSEDEANEDLDDYCETCANLVGDDGKCPDLECDSNPCLHCGGDRTECECVSLPGVAGLELRLRREKEREHGLIGQAWAVKVFGEVSRPSPDFSSPEDFARYLRQHREGRGRGRVEDYE